MVLRIELFLIVFFVLLDLFDVRLFRFEYRSEVILLVLEFERVEEVYWLWERKK